MGHILINTLKTNTSLKIISLILGYFFWVFFSQSRMVTISLTVPVSFYNVAENAHIDAPENITITLSGKRIYFASLDLSSLALHIDAKEFSFDKRPIRISSNNLFLPNGISLVNYMPSPLVIQINKKQVEGVSQA